MDLKDISTENLTYELRNFKGDLTEEQSFRKAHIGAELDNRVTDIQNNLNEFDDISTADWNTIDNILTKLRNKIGVY